MEGWPGNRKADETDPLADLVPLLRRHARHASGRAMAAALEPVALAKS